MGLLVGCFCVLLVLFVMLLIVSVLVRSAVWIANKCLGGSDGKRRRSSYEDDWDDYERPSREYRSNAAIPEPGLFKAMGITILWWIVMFVVGTVMNLALGLGMNGMGGGNNPFGGGGAGGGGNPFGPQPGANPALMLGAGCFQLVLGFLVWAGMLTLMLPTAFPRSLLVTLFLYLEFFVLGILLFIAAFIIGMAGAGLR